MGTPRQLLLKALDGDKAAANELGRLLDNLQGQVGTGIARRRLNTIADGVLVPGLYANWAQLAQGLWRSDGQIVVKLDESESGNAYLLVFSNDNAGIKLDGGQNANAGNQLAFIDFKLNSVLEGNIAVNEATANQPLELNSATANDVSLAVGGGNVGVGTNAPSVRLEVDGNFLADNVLSGVYTPTLSNTTNLDGSTAYECQYMRVGNTVTVSGRADIDPTAGASTVLGITLPIASNFGAAEDCSGVAFSGAVAGQGAVIRANSTTDVAELVFIAVDLANRGWGFTFTYQVI